MSPAILGAYYLRKLGRALAFVEEYAPHVPGPYDTACIAIGSWYDAEGKLVTPSTDEEVREAWIQIENGTARCLCGYGWCGPAQPCVIHDIAGVPRDQ